MSHPALTIRAATARDGDALARLSAREAGWHLGGLALLAEANGAVVAAIGLTSGTVLADPIDPNAAAIRSLRQHRSRILLLSGDVGAAQTLAPTACLFSRQHDDDRGGLKMSTVTDTVRHGVDTEKLTIRVAAKTLLAPERVLDAGRDFSERRADVWSNVKVKHLEVHERGETFADVTEGTWVVGLFWERCRYDWSQPGLVKATVIDSSVFEPGSAWELRATPCDGGSEVEIVLHRGFRRGPKGRIASAVHHTAGEWMWGWFLRRALAAVDRQGA
jgi:hypothetical protein